MNNYLKTMERFGLNANLPDPEFDRPITRLSDAEYQFQLSEKKWVIDHKDDDIENDSELKELKEETEISEKIFNAFNSTSTSTEEADDE